MKRLVLIALGLPAATLAIAACSTSRATYETAPYKVVRADNAFELREYPPLRVATTQQDGDDKSFMRLFGYISGGNSKNEKIAMTTPVFMRDGKMAFVVPEEKRADTPAPSSSQVSLDTMYLQRVAAFRFSGGRSGELQARATNRLKSWIESNGLTSTGKPYFAYYDPPWTPGFLRRNEVLMSVK